VPVRYATDQGIVDIGVLIDVHESGAGLLVPRITPGAFHIWIQFLWFNDRMGAQGQVAYVRQTPDGFHVGVQLHPLPHESENFITGVLMPYGLRKFVYDRSHQAAFLRFLFPKRFQARDLRQRRYLPVIVEQGALNVWAVTEDRTERGAVLLLPCLLRDDAPVRIKTWRSLDAQQGTVVRSEPLDLPPVTVYRVGVFFERQPAGRKGKTAAASSATSQ